jgi:hypothetical protein
MRKSSSEASELSVGATLFRACGDAIVITMTDLSFEGCRISTRTELQAGERCRLYLPGRGCIDVEVQFLSSDRLGLRFLSECRT